MSYDDTTEARRRFYALANKEAAKIGAPPIREPAPELPPALQKFKEWNRGGATEAFIAENARRIDAGMPPLGVNGQPIAAKATAVQPEPPVSDPNHPMHAFFTGAEDFEGRPNPDYASVQVKRYNK